MTKDNLRKQYKWFKFLSTGKFSEEDFKREYKDQEGFSSVGIMPQDRKLLIISDAKRNLKELISKHPFLESEDKPKKTISKEKEKK